MSDQEACGAPKVIQGVVYWHCPTDAHAGYTAITYCGPCTWTLAEHYDTLRSHESYLAWPWLAEAEAAVR